MEEHWKVRREWEEKMEGYWENEKKVLKGF